MKDMGQSARETVAPQINEPHQPAVSNSEQGAFTPGPWNVAVDIHDDRIGIGSTSGVVVFAPHRKGARAGVQTIQDARLIAASPDLLDALHVALGHMTGGMDGDWRDCNPLDVIRAAIAKARGQS